MEHQSFGEGEAGAAAQTIEQPVPPVAGVKRAREEDTSAVVEQQTTAEAPVAAAVEAGALKFKAPSAASAASTTEAVPEDDGDNDQRYCICRLKWDGVTDMIECDKCEEWFHHNCMGVNPNIKEVAYWLCDECESTATKKEVEKAAKAMEQALRSLNASTGASVAASAAPAVPAPAPVVPEVEPMTFEEKKAVRTAIYNLPAESLMEVVKYIHGQCKSAIKVQSDEDLTIDFEQLDVATLRELEARYTKK